MDREKVISNLQGVYEYLRHFENTAKMGEWVSDAIELLKEQKGLMLALEQSNAVNGYLNAEVERLNGLLKEQEAEWIYGEDETGVDGWYCSECSFFEPWFYEFDDDIDFIKHYEHCPKCGRRMTSYTGKQEGR